MNVPADTSLSVRPEEVGLLLDRFVRLHVEGTPWSSVRLWIERGHVLVNDVVQLSTTYRLRDGDSVQLKGRRGRVALEQENRSGSSSAIPVLYQDSQVVVAVKPSGISTEPYDREEKHTLDRVLARNLGDRRPLLVVHRLDKETTGVLVFARTTSAQAHLKNQFRFHTTSRRYVALVHGAPRSHTIRTSLVKDRGDGLRGSTKNLKLGREAITHVRVLEQFARAALIECRLETGRTHQIRIHLSEEGHPILGERVYIRGFRGVLLTAPRVLLHARHLAFNHPSDERRLEFDDAPPNDFEAELAALRGSAR